MSICCNGNHYTTSIFWYAFSFVPICDTQELQKSEHYIFLYSLYLTDSNLESWEYVPFLLPTSKHTYFICPYLHPNLHINLSTPSTWPRIPKPAIYVFSVSFSCVSAAFTLNTNHSFFTQTKASRQKSISLALWIRQEKFTGGHKNKQRPSIATFRLDSK